MFDTYGPFTMPIHDVAGLEHFFEKQIKRDPTHDIEHGFGVYLIAGKDANGELIPLYVGRTHRTFGKRIMQHFKRGRFKQASDNGALEFFFLARAKNGQIIRSADVTNDGSFRAVRYLELVLIGTCLKLNSKLLNKQQTRFHKNLHVAGYLDDGQSERNFPAAQALSKLLKT